MLGNRKLEFEIVEGNLIVSDLTVSIKAIDFVYIEKSNSKKKDEYSIFVNSGHNVVELYYKTPDFDDIYDEFERICTAIQKENPTFNTLPGNPTYIDYGKVEEIRLRKSVGADLIVSFYDQDDQLVSPIFRKNAKENYNTALDLLQQAKADANDIIQESEG